MSLCQDSPLAQQQLALTRYLRDPAGVQPPPALEPRRLKIYEELLYNNVEGFLANGFPVFKSLLSPDRWAQLVRGFFIEHRARSPYFLEMGEEFRTYIESLDLGAAQLPPFTLELLHYEWIELALDVAEAELPWPAGGEVNERSCLQLSPLAVVLAYAYPVAKLGPDFQPSSAPDEPTFMVVHRDSEHRVRFVALNGLTYALLAQVEQAGRLSVSLLVDNLAQLVLSNQQAASADLFFQQTQAMVQRLVDQQILLICEN